MTATPPPAVACRVCGCRKLVALQTRRTARGTIRYRRCTACGTKYKSCEVIECTLSTARNPLKARLDRAAGLAVGILRATDESGVTAADLFARVGPRVPGVTADGFAFRLERDSRVLLGDDSRYRLKPPTA